MLYESFATSLRITDTMLLKNLQILMPRNFGETTLTRFLQPQISSLLLYKEPKLAPCKFWLKPSLEKRLLFKMSQRLGHHYLQLPVFRFTNELLDCTSRDYREYKTADRWRNHTPMCLGCCQLRSWWEWPCYSCCRNIPPRTRSFSYLRWWPPLDFEKCRVMLGKVVLK